MDQWKDNRQVTNRKRIIGDEAKDIYWEWKMKSRQYYWTVSIWILTLLAAVPLVWAASHTGYSGMVTIDRRVKPAVTSLEPSAGFTKGEPLLPSKGTNSMLE